MVSALLTNLAHTAPDEIFSFMYRCRTVPPVYIDCKSACSSRAWKASCVCDTGSCEEFV